MLGLPEGQPLWALILMGWGALHVYEVIADIIMQIYRNYILTGNKQFKEIRDFVIAIAAVATLIITIVIALN